MGNPRGKMTDEILVPIAERDRWRLVINQLKALGTGQEANTGAINTLNSTVMKHLESHTKRVSWIPGSKQIKRIPIWLQVLIAFMSTSGATALIAAAFQ